MRGPPSHVNASIWLEVSGWDPPPPYPAVGPLHITAITSSTLQRRRYGHGQDGRRASVSSWRNSSSTHSKGEWLTKSGQTTGQGAVSKESPPPIPSHQRLAVSLRPYRRWPVMSSCSPEAYVDICVIALAVRASLFPQKRQVCQFGCCHHRSVVVNS